MEKGKHRQEKDTESIQPAPPTAAGGSKSAELGGAVATASDTVVISKAQQDAMRTIEHRLRASGSGAWGKLKVVGTMPADAQWVDTAELMGRSSSTFKVDDNGRVLKVEKNPENDGHIILHQAQQAKELQEITTRLFLPILFASYDPRTRTVTSVARLITLHSESQISIDLYRLLLINIRMLNIKDLVRSPQELDPKNLGAQLWNIYSALVKLKLLYFDAKPLNLAVTVESGHLLLKLLDVASLFFHQDPVHGKLKHMGTPGYRLEDAGEELTHLTKEAYPKLRMHYAFAATLREILHWHLRNRPEQRQSAKYYLRHTSTGEGFTLDDTANTAPAVTAHLLSPTGPEETTSNAMTTEIVAAKSSQPTHGAVDNYQHYSGFTGFSFDDSLTSSGMIIQEPDSSKELSGEVQICLRQDYQGENSDPVIGSGVSTERQRHSLFTPTQQNIDTAEHNVENGSAGQDLQTPLPSIG